MLRNCLLHSADWCIFILHKIQKNRSILWFARGIIHEFASVSELIDNYKFFSLCQKTSVYDATSSDLRSVESLGIGKSDIRYFDVTFRQCHLNQCHKSVLHANAHRDLRDAMRSYVRKYLPIVKITIYHTKVINSPLSRTIHRAGRKPRISPSFINFRCTQSSFISWTLLWTSFHFLKSSRCTRKIVGFLARAQAMSLICCLNMNTIRIITKHHESSMAVNNDNVACFIILQQLFNLYLLNIY